MGIPIRVLIIEDSENDAQLVLHEIQRGEYDIEWERVETRTAMLDALVRRQWDIIICDHSLPEFHAMSALGTLQARGFDLPFIIVSGSISEEAAVNSLKAGAHDFILKGNLARLIPAIQRELRDAKTRHERKQAEGQLRLSDQILQRVNALVIVADSRGKIVYVSPAVKTILGYEPEELLGDEWWKVSRSEPAAAQHEKEYLGQAARREIPIATEAYERVIEDRSGNTHWISWVDAAGPGDLVIGVGHDVTERKLAEKTLLASEMRYRRLFEAAKDGILILNADTGEIVDVNPFLLEMVGYSHAEFLGKQLWEIGFFKDIVANKAAFLKLQEEGYIRYENLPLETKDGHSIWVEFVSNAYDVSGKQVIQCNIRDITERKRSEDQLHYHARLLRYINDAVIATDEQLRITAWNRAAETMFGWSGAEVMGRNLTEILNFELTDEQRAEARELLKESIASRSERIYHRKDGRTIYVEANTIALTNVRSKLTGFVSVNRDITERKGAEEQTQLQLQRLKALRAIDIAISSSFNLTLTLNLLLDQVIEQLKTDAAAVLLFNPITRTLEYAASRGFRSVTIREARVRLGEGYAGKAVLERRVIHIPNLMETDIEPTQALLLKNEDFTDYYCVPLIVKGEVKGVLEIFHRGVLADSSEWLDFLDTLAGQAAIAIENATLFENLQLSNSELFQAYDATIVGWSHALDLRDKETEGHTLRVTELTLDLARKFGFPEEQLRYMRWGALLHDIGKMGVPDSILLKPDTLTDEEWESMKKHPVFALEMLSPITYLKSSIDIPYCHHEKWDGSGYPRGLKGEVIPLAARLFAVVDVWDALRTDRPYRKAWPREKTLEHIKSLSGTHFEPKVVEHFLDFIGQSNQDRANSNT